MSKIGDIFKRLRTESKITQKQIADYLNVDQSMVAKLESGERNFSASIIEKTCNLFCCTEDYLKGDIMDDLPLKFSFRSEGLCFDDLKDIAKINKIVLNKNFINKMLEGNNDKK